MGTRQSQDQGNKDNLGVGKSVGRFPHLLLNEHNRASWCKGDDIGHSKASEAQTSAL